MNTVRNILLLTVCIAAVALSQVGKNVWKAELDDDVKRIVPVLNGSYTFLSSEEYAWLFHNATGKKVWSVEIDEFSEKAPHHLVNDTLYLVANEDTLLCYSMTGNMLLWKRSYTGVEQSRFTGLHQMDTLLILSYGTLDIGIGLNDGREAWRVPVEAHGSLVEKGTVNTILVPAFRKYFVITEKDECLLINAEDGKRLLSLPLSEPNGDLVKQKRAWYYLSPDQKLAAFVFEKNFIAVNVETNKLVAQIPVNIDDQYNVLVTTPFGCAAIAKDRVVHFHSGQAKVTQVPVAVGSIRSLYTVQTDSAAVLVLGTEDKLQGWNLETGKVLWQTPLKFQPGKGFLHRFVAQDSNDVIATYLDPSQDLKLSLMSINAATGAINYRTMVAHSDESLPGRTLPLPALPAAATVPLSFGFENAGFDYEVSAAEGQAVFVIRTASEMYLPDSEKRGGEGLIRVDMKTGQVLAKNYLRIADGLSFDGGFGALAKTLAAGELLMMPGNKNLTALDARTGALRWMLIEQDVNGSYILDMTMIDSLLYVRTGGMKQEFVYDKKKDKLTRKTVWEEDDYSILAVDTSNGKVLWKRDFKKDPGQVFRNYSLARYAKGGAALFVADDEFLTALSLDPKKNGAPLWTFEFSDSGVGGLDYDELFQRSVHWDAEGNNGIEQDNDGFIALAQSSVAGAPFTVSVSKILHVEFDNTADKLFLFGDDGIAAVNTVTGRKDWTYEWDYSAKAIHQAPVRVNGHIMYVIDGMAVLLNEKNGKVIATSKVDKDAGVFLMPDRYSMVIVDGDEVTGIVVPKP